MRVRVRVRVERIEDQKSEEGSKQQRKEGRRQVIEEKTFKVERAEGSEA